MPGLIFAWGWISQLPETLPPLLKDIPALEAFLLAQIQSNSEIGALAVIHTDGGLIAQCQMPDNLPFILRMCAAQVAMSLVLCEVTGRGAAEDMYIKFPPGYIWLAQIDQVIVVILLPHGTKI